MGWVGTDDIVRTGYTEVLLGVRSEEYYSEREKCFQRGPKKTFWVKTVLQTQKFERRIKDGERRTDRIK